MPDTSSLHKRLNGLLSENRTVPDSIDKTIILRDTKDTIHKTKKKTIDKLIFEEVNVYQENSKECIKIMHVMMLN